MEWFTENCWWIILAILAVVVALSIVLIILVKKDKKIKKDFQEKISENPVTGVDILYSTYSFYDTDAFLRYDKNLDKNAIGGYYNDYNQSTYVEGVSYLKIDALNTIYADYSLVEQTPAVDEEPIEDETEDEKEKKVDGADVWLLVSSLLVAVALLVAVIALIVRKVVAKVRKKRANTAKAQSRSASRRSKKND